MDSKKRELKAFIALSLLAMSSTGIINNCSGVFYNALSKSLNVSMGAVTFYVTVICVSSSIFCAITPRFVNQKNYKRQIVLNSLICDIALILIGKANSIYIVYLLSVVVGICMTFFSNSVINLLIVNNFESNVGKYSSWIYCFSGVVGIVLSPVLTMIIENYNYSIGYLVSGVASFILTLPVLFVDLKVDFKDEETKEAGSSKVNKGLFVLYFLMSCTFYMISNFPQHVINYSSLKGIDSLRGSYLLSAAMTGNVVFKPINGILTDKLGGIKTSLIIVLANLSGIILLYLTNNYALMLFACFIFATNYTMSSFMHPLLCRELFRDKYYSIFPIMMMVGALSAAVASFLYGRCFDLTGNYNLVIYAIICFDIFNIISLTYLNSKQKHSVVNK